LAFEELLVQERLLKAGDLLRFDGPWGDPYTNKLFRVTRAEVTQRVRLIALSAPTRQHVVDIDTIGLNPEHSLFAYEVRIGVGQGLVKLYARWPTNDFTRQLQDPNFQVNPADADLKLIGFSDHVSSLYEDPRFRWFWVKDQLPSFVALADSGSLAVPMYQKVKLRFIVNILGLVEEKDSQTLQKVQSGELFVSAAQHYELLGRRGA
jgi:hypothetical protein